MHIVTLKVGGYIGGYNGLFGGSNYSASAVGEAIKQALINNRIGVASVTNIPYGLNPAYLEYTVNIEALDTHSDETVKSLVYRAVLNVLNPLTVDVLASTQAGTPSANNPNSNDSGFLDKLLNSAAKGLGTGAGNAAGGLATVMVGQFVIGGALLIGAAIILPRILDRD